MGWQCLVQMFLLSLVRVRGSGDMMEVVWTGTPSTYSTEDLGFPEVPEIFGYMNALPNEEEEDYEVLTEVFHEAMKEVDHETHQSEREYHTSRKTEFWDYLVGTPSIPLGTSSTYSTEDLGLPQVPEIFGYMSAPRVSDFSKENQEPMEEEDDEALEEEEPHESSPHQPEWEHTGSRGTEFWGSINHNCLGFRQSPINIDNTKVVRENTMGRGIQFYNYEQVDAKTTLLENNGHTVELKVVNPPAPGPTMAGGHLPSTYNMAQLHFHWAPNDTMGSEHTVDKESFPLEMHIVHLATDIALDQMGGLAVAGFVFKITPEDNPEMEAMIERIPFIHHEHQETHLTDGNFNVMKLIQASQSGSYYSYEGSLTTPGCNEVVQWVLFTTPLSISSRQLAMFRTVLDWAGNPILQNFRPVQQLNGRTVVLNTR